MKYLDDLDDLMQEIEGKNKIDFETQRSKTQEIEDAIKQINLKYEDKINQNMLEKEELIEKYYKIADIIEKYSSFQVSTIGQVLTELISTYKQEKYASYIPKYKLCYPNYLLDAILVIMPEEKEYFFNTYVNDDDDTIVSFKKIKDDVNIIVYTKEDSLLSPRPNIKYNIIHNDDKDNPGNLLFIKEFIDYVINYRIENKIDDISLEELEKLKDEFINNHQVEIEEYYKKNNLTLKREKN